MRAASRNLTWTPAMTEFILKYLVEEVRAGQKNQKGFKARILSDAPEAANKKFGKKTMYCHVQNHLKTVNKTWQRIEYIKSMEFEVRLPILIPIPLRCSLRCTIKMSRYFTLP
jgi:Myb/SANT-like DNA-binding domain